MTVEQQVAQHYTRDQLESAIFTALTHAGKDIHHLQPDDLAPVDEFHIGGREATIEFAAQLRLRPGMHVLDIGSGLGGPSRYIAATYGCRVSGIDLTEQYVRVAGNLAQRVGMQDNLSYRQGSALELPFAPATFDGAYMMHVGMNIDDKLALFTAVRRVLRPGGVFGIYDVMADRDGALAFPLPWSSTPELSFVASPATYRAQLERAGFVVEQERNRRGFAAEFLRQTRAELPADGSPPFSVALLMGPDAGEKIGNMMANLERGLLRPTEIVARVRPSGPA